MITESAQQSLAMLRDTSNFTWYVIPLLMIVVYIYTYEADRKNWSRFLAGIAFWAMDLFNEIWNGLVFHFSEFAPVWGIAGDTSLLLLMGLNIEISFMFAVAGIAATLALPVDKHLKWFGINNRIWFAVINSILCVTVEVMLNRAGVLVWEWDWWNYDAPWLIFLIGYMPFFTVCYWVYDMESRQKQITVVSSILALDTVVIGLGLYQGWL